jgi:DNA-binding ferritin-like protein
MNADTRAKVMQKVVETINPVIADGFALYEKTRTFYLNAARWPESDKRLFAEQADEIFASMDMLAGQAREMGGTPLRSISHAGELQSVEGYNRRFLSPGEMIGELNADNQQMAASLRIACAICEKMCDLSIGILLQDILRQTEGRVGLLTDAEVRTQRSDAPGPTSGKR